MSFQKKLKQIIVADFKSQKKFADAIGVSKTVITKYLNTDRKPSFVVLQKIGTLGYNIKQNKANGEITMILQLKHWDKIDLYLWMLIFSWVLMWGCLAYDEMLGFTFLLGFNCIFTPYTGVLLRNQMKKL